MMTQFLAMMNSLERRAIEEMTDQEYKDYMSLPRGVRYNLVKDSMMQAIRKVNANEKATAQTS
ncbi:MAG: hypothetical protein WCY93_12295 [Anaerolineaceae bacterium]